MPTIKHNPDNIFPPYRNYSHAVEVKGDSSLLFISGLNGYLQDGQTMPNSFEEQGEIIWQHIGTIFARQTWTTKTLFQSGHIYPTQVMTKQMCNYESNI